jgi:transposase
VPGRKRAWHAAQWLQKWPTLGVLQASCRPEAERCVWRTLLRHRAPVIAHRAPHLLHLQQALQLLNSPVSEGLTEITGVTGQTILRAI